MDADPGSIQFWTRWLWLSTHLEYARGSTESLGSSSSWGPYNLSHVGGD